ncbi:hypothetical protein [Mesobacillus zeae]|uniref:DUF2325 domain-containing protein n=1 Tax=Mesobacillus zeae TaxID=1917180 RepID=A0A398AZB9_9BACI|nr:hypothetical protein [Mesobacillus zeae]RID82831.1 hypothetical protein D1970_17785 [Mesobacillus zeae]
MTNLIEIQKLETAKVHQFLCIALGCNTFIHPLIDELYSKDEWDYYEAFQKCEWKNKPLFSMYTTKSEEKIRQVAGIVAWSYQSKQFAQVDQLIKKGYKYVYQYMQQHINIDFEHFMRSFAKRQKKNIVKEIELIYQNIVLWYLCVRENKPFNQTNVAWKSFLEVLNTSINETEVQNSLFSKKVRDQHTKEIDELYKEFNIPKNQRFDSLGFLLEYLISSSIRKIYETTPGCPTKKAEEQVFQDSPAKYIGAIGGWLKTLKIHELDATEQVPLTKTDLDNIFLELLYAKKYNHITNEEQALFFITCLYMKCMSSHYEQTKQLYLDQSKQDYYLAMKLKESRIHEQEAMLIQRQREWHFSNEQKEREIEGLSKNLREAHSKIRQLEQQITNMEDYSDEVHALRNYIHLEEQNDSHFKSAPSMKTMTEYIQSKRLLIFGGAPIWQQKLKTLFPNIEFVDVTEVNRDISKIQRVDAVFINTKVFSHAFYKKIIKELSKTDTPLYYLNGQSNMEKITEEIYRWLTE